MTEKLNKDRAISVDDIDGAPDVLPNPPAPIDDPEVLRSRLLDTQSENGSLHEEIVKLRAQVRKYEATKRTAEVLDKLIEPYAKRAFIFMCVYSAAVGTILILDGFSICKFDLDPNVLTYLVGSTAVTVIGLVGMVLTGIFVGARGDG